MDKIDQYITLNQMGQVSSQLIKYALNHNQDPHQPEDTHLPHKVEDLGESSSEIGVSQEDDQKYS